jgi:hypothetical protein
MTYDNYTEEEIKIIKNIGSYDMLDLLKTKTLSFDFVINYILNEKYQISRKEKNITIDTVVNYQPHLKDIFIKILKDNNMS